MKQSILLITAILCGAILMMGQGGGGAGKGKGGGGAAAAKGKAVPEEGIPVTSDLVIAKCGTCHTKDEKGNLSRISYSRATPEGWEEAIKRMVRLNGLSLQPAEARTILKYLGTNHGLAPEEAKPLMYMAEHRIQDEVIPNESIRTTCMQCHALGRAFQWHRTKEDWTLLTNMHVAFFPQADAAFRRGANGNGGGGGEAAPAAAPGAAPVSLDTSLDFLATKYGLHTPEWSAWKARMRTPKIAGKWMVLAHIPGKGQYAGEMTVTQGAAEDEFTTSTTLKPLMGSGPAITRTGTGLVYAGYSWRGRSKATTAVATPRPGELSSEMREAMWLSPDQTSGEGRWFWGEYQEFGLDVTLKRVTGAPTLFTMDKPSLMRGTTAQQVKLMGSSLPATVTAADLDFGPGVTVKSIVSKSATEVVASVDIAPTAVFGKRDVALGLAVLPSAYAVYDKVDYIKVTPDTALSRLGSDVHPKGYQQFEAVGVNRGEDGKLHTADDVEIGPIEVTWAMEEFYAVFGDDDRDFVGSLNDSGLFTPNTDGPNPARKFSRNNYGDVWAVATATKEKDKEGKPLTGKSYLVVTVPTYIRWDQPEVGQ
ncbi:MAG: quinohemoprotein amine dehydrogenase subunit alpha [Bryobacteraceae bacterium]